MIDGVEELADVHVQYPVHRLALDSYNQGIERVVRTATGLISIREPQEIGFILKTAVDRSRPPLSGRQ